MSEVIVYSTPTCPWCAKAKQFLKNHDIDFRDVDVTADESSVEELKRISGQLGIPVITDGDVVIVGFDQPRLQELAKGREAK